MLRAIAHGAQRAILLGSLYLYIRLTSVFKPPPLGPLLPRRTDSSLYDTIRNGGPTSCNIQRGFEEAMTCHMATRSFLEGRRVRWDPEGRRIV